MKSEVALLRCLDYDYAGVKEAVYSSINMIGGTKSLHISGKDRVLLKVNLLGARKPEDAVTTHPAIAKALTEYFQDAGAEVHIGDSSAAGPAETRRALEVSGIERVAEETKAKAVNFEAEGFAKVQMPKGIMHLNELYVAKSVLNSDFVVSVPKLKNHNLTKFTGALKNLFGTIPTATRMKLHSLGDTRSFSQGIVDVYSVVRPGLALMDGVIGMDGNGPSYGNIRRTGIIAASKDSVALDAVCSRIVGYGENEIFTTVEAAKRDLGHGALREIRVTGADPKKIDIHWEKVKMMPLDKVPRPLFRFVMRFLYTRPKLVKAKCLKCATCASHCPAHAIRLNPYPVLDYSRCLRCYTCNEICPNGAYELHKSLLANVAYRFGVQS